MNQNEYFTLIVSDSVAALLVTQAELESWPAERFAAAASDAMRELEGRRELIDRQTDALQALLLRTRRSPSKVVRLSELRPEASGEVPA